MDTVEAINQLCVGVDEDMRAQHAIPQLRLKYPLKLQWVQARTLCPDWPEERVNAFAARRERWVAADVAEEALQGHLIHDGLPIGDAVWLLLQPGVIPQRELNPYIVSCAEHAVAYAYEAAMGTLEVRSHADWRKTELSCRQMTAQLRRALPLGDRAVNKMTLAARAAGIAAWLLRSEEQVIAMPEAFSVIAPTPEHLTARLAQLAAVCCNHGPQPELLRQLKHLHALVT